MGPLLALVGLSGSYCYTNDTFLTACPKASPWRVASSISSADGMRDPSTP
jgi:hypothetical protein